MTQKAYLDLTLLDESVVRLTLNFGDLYVLREKYPEIYDSYNKIMQRGIGDEFDSLTILYTAYVCANMDNQFLDFLEFLRLIPVDRSVIANTINYLILPEKTAKKKQDLLTLLKSRNTKKLK